MNLIEKAIELAVKAHAGQVDKAGKPYILHPLRLMLRMDDEASMIAAVLHDIVEDTDLGLDVLRASGFPEAAIEAVDCLTKRKNEDYEAFIQRLEDNRIARKVKIADLEDNMNIARFSKIGSSDLERLARYHRALMRLKSLAES
jgi:(p)ppGpp synthase/HD superfamily hydrolase